MAVESGGAWTGGGGAQVRTEGGKKSDSWLKGLKGGKHCLVPSRIFKGGSCGAARKMDGANWQKMRCGPTEK